MKILETIKADYRAVVKNDPAFPGGIRGILEVILCYPGFHAVLAHRLLHFLHVRLKVPVLPRFLGQIVRWWTGIEIHPGATVGKGVFIDHGMGVVVGETAVIGDNVTIYQGVTLGATGNERGTKRHPTVAEGAFIGSGARILGNITVGAHSRVGAGSVVVKDVPSGATVVGVPARIVRQRDESGNVSPQKADERPSSEEIKGRMEAMENEIKDLRQKLSQIERKHYVEAI